MGKIVAATIAAKRHLSLARVLANSFREHHPEIPFFVLLADEVDGRFDPSREPFQILQLSELAIPTLARFRFHYRQQELTYAATPYLLAHLLQRGFTSACFLVASLIHGSDSMLRPMASSISRTMTVVRSFVSGVKSRFT